MNEPHDNPSAATGHPDIPPPDGRLIVISGPMGGGCHRLAWAMARLCEQSVVLDGPILAGMVASERASGADELGTIRTSLLRYCGHIALAETYRRAGYDVIIVEDLPEARLDDFLDLACPDDVHLIVLDGSHATYPQGLHVLFEDDLERQAVRLLERLDEALLPSGRDPHQDPPAR
ncbi:hypothetical protein KEM60_00727 [Austwickia sp. TVS 96-490-7B]|uniref:hypothetical protein n=1 Tax=Austwickia sp. TVS 96-490-7B TaxID=2830843 RepID=UPI001C5A0E95|nr:hypothetical protein [Austwickia sp. TVS 96-490-7B]MBW3084539.1 hypothetical protein [Austwickia sp. TVS 96-490-7B]